MSRTKEVKTILFHSCKVAMQHSCLITCSSGARTWRTVGGGGGGGGAGSSARMSFETPLTTGEIAAASCLIEFTVAGGSGFAPARQEGMRQRAEQRLLHSCTRSSHAGEAHFTDGDFDWEDK